MAWSSSLKSLLTVFVFINLAVSSVESYQCTVYPCETEPCADCETTKGCFNQIQRFDTPSSLTDGTFKQKGCIADSNTCSSLSISVTLGDQRTFTYTNSCCTTEKCNQGDLTLPTPSSTPNGVECPACYNEKANLCSSVTTLKCTGEEKKCIEVSGRGVGASNLVIYGKGCATENSCNLDMTVLGRIQIKTACSSPPSNHGHPTAKFVSSFLIFLLPLKFLL
ncbi:protein RoBo-1-like [Chionomys nivalis]|uniref:protein RoBo-1-like n=1 Tax=Chionomys nivalis TaxID=269649 RepID=UPI00259796A1|nr:protein RoBo-1-like [Chionomys nivalis]XP_057632129.1 protein RoBo-1-like [Chionomys nivalis]